jgi:hypothetical protein
VLSTASRSDQSGRRRFSSFTRLEAQVSIVIIVLVVVVLVSIGIKVRRGSFFWWGDKGKKDGPKT